MQVRLKRVYDQPGDQDGTRVLVDRLWPRGIKKGNAAVDLWLKDIAPSNELRRWFSHEPTKWPEFKKRYFEELEGKGDALQKMVELASRGKVTLLYSSKEEKFNNAVALKEYIEEKGRRLQRG
jgi:uncharacterized protein YeaO (DUF488 family)